MPAIRAIKERGGLGKAAESPDQGLDGVENLDGLIAVTRPNRPEASVLVGHVAWGRSYATLIGTLEVTDGVYLLTDLGKDLLSLDEQVAKERIRELDREYRRKIPKRKPVRRSTDAGRVIADDSAEPSEGSEAVEDLEWSSVLLTRCTN